MVKVARTLEMTPEGMRLEIGAKVRRDLQNKRKRGTKGRGGSAQPTKRDLAR